MKEMKKGRQFAGTLKHLLQIYRNVAVLDNPETPGILDIYASDTEMPVYLQYSFTNRRFFPKCATLVGRIKVSYQEESGSVCAEKIYCMDGYGELLEDIRNGIDCYIDKWFFEEEVAFDQFGNGIV